MMEKAMARSDRNGYVSILKLISSVFVVFVHIVFPGKFGRVMGSLGRFGVIFFFCVSGYYAYRVGVPVLKKRLKKMVELTILANGIYFVWNVFHRYVILHRGTRSYISDLLTVKTVARFVFMGDNPFAAHLWYLTAMILVYLIMIVYTRFWDSPDEINYTPLYCVAVCGYLFQIIFAVKVKGTGTKIDFMVYRYCLYNGLPAFCMGLFLHQYRERIVKNYCFSDRKAALMIVIGSAICLLQWFGIGSMSMPVGTVAVVIALMLFATQPRPASPLSPAKRAFFICAETCSTVIYVIHLLIGKAIDANAKRIPALGAIRSHVWLYPLFVLLVSALIGVCVSIILYVIRGKKAARGVHA